MSRAAGRLGLSGALMGLSTLLVAVPARGDESLATIRRLSGSVEVRHSDRWSDARVGDALVAGDTLRTGIRSRATLRDSAGNVVELYPLSELAFPDPGRLDLVVGRLWSHFVHAVGQPWQIRTPAAVALIRGTTLAVEAASDSAEVTVLEGLVEVQGQENQIQMVPGGRTVHAAAWRLGEPREAEARILDEGRRFLREASPFQSTFDGLMPRLRPDALQRAEAMDRDRTIQMFGPGSAPGSGPREGGRPGGGREDRGRPDREPRAGRDDRQGQEGRPVRGDGPGWDEARRGDRGDPPGRGRPPREGAPFRRGPWPPGPARP